MHIRYGLRLGFLLLGTAVRAPAQPATDAFPQAVAEFQASKSREAAERVIRLAGALDAAPSIPEDARRHFVRGGVRFKDARSADDFEAVLHEFSQAVLLAPGWPEARYNLAITEEAAGHYAAAIDHLKLYRLFPIPEDEARQVQDRIYALEIKQERSSAPPPAPRPVPVPASPPAQTWDFLTGVWDEWLDGREMSRHEFRVLDGGIERRTLSSAAAARHGGRFSTAWMEFSPRTWFGVFDGEKFVQPNESGDDFKIVHKFTRIVSPSHIVSEFDYVDLQRGKTQHSRTEFRKVE